MLYVLRALVHLVLATLILIVNNIRLVMFPFAASREVYLHAATRAAAYVIVIGRTSLLVFLLILFFFFIKVFHQDFLFFLLLLLFDFFLYKLLLLFLHTFYGEFTHFLQNNSSGFLAFLGCLKVFILSLKLIQPLITDLDSQAFLDYAFYLRQVLGLSRRFILEALEEVIDAADVLRVQVAFH